MTLGGLAAQYGLIVMGHVKDTPDKTIYLLGTGPDFWPLFTQSDEYNDGQPDPLDRWSQRVLPHIMEQLEHGREVVYPFGGPPYAPFIRWATESGEAFQSPAGMLVHKTAGLMISYRGAISVSQAAPEAATAPSPCLSCTDQPCATACPVDALSAEDGYNVAACHSYLDTTMGQDCLKNGCKARRACPISISFGRDPAQSAFHMKSFHPSAR